MGKFAVIPADTFDEMQLDAGILLSNFTLATQAFQNSDIICATTGGIQITCTPTYSDMGSDVDNCPNNTKELKHLDSWECTIAFTALGVTPEVIKLALGAADITAASGLVTPRGSVSSNDFADLWWVGDRADGGIVAVHLKNALSTGGFSLKTTKNGKGQLSVTLTGHVAQATPTEVPMLIYSADKYT